MTKSGRPQIPIFQCIIILKTHIVNQTDKIHEQVNKHLAIRNTYPEKSYH